MLHFNDRLNAAVESAIVGYTTITMEAGKWYLVGTPFGTLNDSTAKLNDIFKSDDFTSDDKLQIYDPSSGYTPYYWKDNVGWVSSVFASTAADVNIPAGQGVFIYKATKAGTLTFSGKVTVGEIISFGKEGTSTWNQLVCVYPETVKLNAIKWGGLTDGDRLQIYVPSSGYTPYYWKVGVGWVSSVFASTAADVNIPAGHAVFINCASAGTAQYPTTSTNN